MKLENRRKLVQVLLEKSRKSLAAASLLAKDGFSEAAISRAYYGAFYLAQAALATKDISRSKHSGVIAAFGEHLTKKGLLPEALHKTFLNLYESRVTSDYSVEAVPSSNEGSRIRQEIHRISRELFAGVAGKDARGITFEWRQVGFFPYLLGERKGNILILLRANRGKVSLDIFWLRDENLEESDNLQLSCSMFKVQC